MDEEDVDMQNNKVVEQCDEVEEGPPEIYLPGRSRPLEDDEEMVMDKSAYRLYYQLQVEAPSLSFDVLLDCLGDSRQVEVNGSESVTAYVVAGTQTNVSNQNSLVVMRLANMKPLTNKELKVDDDDESEKSSDSESESDSDEDLDSLPVVEAAKMNHPTGVVNRVRAHQFNGIYMAATWSEAGEVHIWDLTRPMAAVNDSAVMSEYTRNRESPTPIFTFKGHRDEGYGLAWSPCSGAAGHLATGDSKGDIHLWQPRPTGWAVSEKPLQGHTGSVEEIQWSPTEPTVFITTSTDCSFRVWDTRSGPKASAMISVPDAHETDVNVASWGSQQPGSLVTGADDGCIRVWDLRMVHKRYGGSGNASISAFTHSFDFHKAPITSIEWHPNDAGIFLASSEDDQTTLWDIGLEQDASESPDDAPDLPVQLLFMHGGQEEVKEGHWHPQIPGLIINTALDGFNVFRTICV